MMRSPPRRGSVCRKGGTRSKLISQALRCVHCAPTGTDSSNFTEGSQRSVYKSHKHKHKEATVFN